MQSPHVCVLNITVSVHLSIEFNWNWDRTNLAQAKEGQAIVAIISGSHNGHHHHGQHVL